MGEYLHLVRNALFVFLDHLEAVIMRPVIEYDEFKVLECLIDHRLNGLLEQVGPIVVGDDDADGRPIHWVGVLGSGCVPFAILLWQARRFHGRQMNGSKATGESLRDRFQRTLTCDDLLQDLRPVERLEAHA